MPSSVCKKKEYGEAWHQVARLGSNKVAMDDFAAYARSLADKGYTSKSKIATEGGSAVGLLVYATLVHYHCFMKAAVVHVEYVDVLRTELEPNGAFNVTEFGTVKDSVQFRGMYAFSPYLHFVDGKPPPSALFPYATLFR